MPRVTHGNFPVPHPEIKEHKPRVLAKDYKHSLVSSKRQNVASLLTHVEGTALTVYYYSQVLGRDEEPSTFDPYKDGVNQQYVLIKNMEIKLQSELNTSIDTSDQTLSLSGTAVLYPYNKPNVGDVFIADIGDGQAGLFSVVEVEKKSMFKQACYEIQFTLSDYMSEKLDTILNNKVVKETEFVKDFMLYGQNPVLATEEKMRVDALTDIKADALSDWLSEFYSNEYKTILVPMSTAVYDPFVLTMMLKIFNKYEHPLLNQIALLNTDDQNLWLHNDVWDVLLQREYYMLRSCFRSGVLADSKQFIRNPFLQSVYWSGVKKIVFPLKNDFHTDDALKITRQYTGSVIRTSDNENSVEFTLPDTSDGGYVFSKNFYENGYTQGISTLEHLVYNYLSNKANDWQVIVKALENRHEWSKMERFYYIPVMLVLVIAELRGI